MNAPKQTTELIEAHCQYEATLKLEEYWKFYLSKNPKGFRVSITGRNSHDYKFNFVFPIVEGLYHNPSDHAQNVLGTALQNLMPIIMEEVQRITKNTKYHLKDKLENVAKETVISIETLLSELSQQELPLTNCPLSVDL